MFELVEIEEIEIFDGEEIMYDLEVETDKSYNANGIIVHNSEFCIEMNGKIISVNSAANQRQQMMNTTNPEDVKQVTPWLPVSEIQNLSISQIMDKGVVLPPYHFNCRTTVVAAA